jgi:hypothetical protein
MSLNPLWRWSTYALVSLELVLIIFLAGEYF